MIEDEVRKFIEDGDLEEAINALARHSDAKDDATNFRLRLRNLTDQKRKAMIGNDEYQSNINELGSDILSTAKELDAGHHTPDPDGLADNPDGPAEHEVLWPKITVFGVTLEIPISLSFIRRALPLLLMLLLGVLLTYAIEIVIIAVKRDIPAITALTVDRARPTVEAELYPTVVAELYPTVEAELYPTVEAELYPAVVAEIHAKAQKKVVILEGDTQATEMGYQLYPNTEYQFTLRPTDSSSTTPQYYHWVSSTPDMINFKHNSGPDDTIWGKTHLTKTTGVPVFIMTCVQEREYVNTEGCGDNPLTVVGKFVVVMKPGVAVPNTEPAIGE